MMFFLGTHQPHWLGDARLAGVPLFISRTQLSRGKSLPRAGTSFALDSGGFTELQLYGRWRTSADQYADEIRVYARHFGASLVWVAPQDWMCEPIVLSGGAADRGISFAGTGLTVEEHQRRTVANFVELRRLLGEFVIPVLQGWALADYWRCEQMYADAGVCLEDERTVGVGSVCRRQGMGSATNIMATLANGGLRLHGFGFKKVGIRANREHLTSADSLAWSDAARRGPVCLEGHDKPGPGRRFGHKNCANCLEFAMQWRDEIETDAPQRQMGLFA